MCRDVVKQQVEKQLEKNADGHYLIEQDVAFKNILKVLEEAYKLRDEKKKRYTHIYIIVISSNK